MGKQPVPKRSWRFIIDTQWRGLSSAEKLVALAILARSNEEGFATLSYGDIQDMTRLDKRTVSTATDHMHTHGALEKNSNGPSKPFRYRLHISKWALGEQKCNCPK
jgi:hypothetical protein